MNTDPQQLVPSSPAPSENESSFSIQSVQEAMRKASKGASELHKEMKNLSTLSEATSRLRLS